MTHTWQNENFSKRLSKGRGKGGGGGGAVPIWTLDECGGSVTNFLFAPPLEFVIWQKKRKRKKGGRRGKKGGKSLARVLKQTEIKGVLQTFSSTLTCSNTTCLNYICKGKGKDGYIYYVGLTSKSPNVHPFTGRERTIHGFPGGLFLTHFL